MKEDEVKYNKKVVYFGVDFKHNKIIVERGMTDASIDEFKKWDETMVEYDERNDEIQVFYKL